MPDLNPDGRPDDADVTPDSGGHGDLQAQTTDHGDVGGTSQRDPLEGIRSLDLRTIALDRTVGAISAAVVEGLYLLTLAAVFLTGAWPWWGLWLLASAWVPLTAFLLWLAVKWPEVDFRHRRYRVAADAIEIWSGVVWRHAVIVPRSRVQHIDVSRGPLERSFGLATITIHTAGTSYSKVDLSGLAHDDALRIRDALLPKDAESAV